MKRIACCLPLHTLKAYYKDVKREKDGKKDPSTNGKWPVFTTRKIASVPPFLKKEKKIQLSVL